MGAAEMSPLLGADLVAFVASTDLDRSRHFYGDILGLAVVSVGPYACVLRSGPSSLRVALVESLTPAPSTVLGWTVPDLPAALDRLDGLGVRLLRYDGTDQDARGVWTTPLGDRVVWFADPDGNVLSLTSLADATGSGT